MAARWNRFSADYNVKFTRETGYHVYWAMASNRVSTFMVKIISSLQYLLILILLLLLIVKPMLGNMVLCQEVSLLNQLFDLTYIVFLWCPGTLLFSHFHQTIWMKQWIAESAGHPSVNTVCFSFTLFHSSEFFQPLLHQAIRRFRT